MRRFLMLVVTTAALALPMLATAAPASAGEGCFTPHVKGFDSFEVCGPIDPRPR